MENEENSTANVRIVCPKAEELSVIVNNVKCLECGLSFSNEPRLRMHVLKTHEHKNLLKNAKEDVRYHCPESMCVYALKSSRFFTTMKYLKQHYLKVHATKKFPCTQCDKKFSTMAARLAHYRVCGIQFVCSCLRVFGTYEALLTHGKRNLHAIDEKYKKIISKKTDVKGPPQFVSASKGKKPVLILPHKTITPYAQPSGKIAFDVAVQTDEIKRQKRTPSPTKTSRRRESRQTQTLPSGKEKRARITVETQTTQKMSRQKILSERRMHEKVVSASTENIPSIGTESSPSREKTTEKLPSSDAQREKNSSKACFSKDPSLNEHFGPDNIFSSSPVKLEHELENFWEEKNASLGTQTSPEKDLLEALSDSVTQTDFVSFYDGDEQNCLTIENCYPFDSRTRITRSDPMLTTNSFADRFSSIETQTEAASRNFFQAEVARSFALSSNNETQTTENFDNIEQLLYSNTCTQTCNDILPPDLELSDIQTQTAWPELDPCTISSQTQTPLTSGISSSCRSWLNARIHTETQTDLLSIFDEFP